MLDVKPGVMNATMNPPFSRAWSFQRPGHRRVCEPRRRRDARAAGSVASSDLWIMYQWCGRWLAGEGLYTAADTVTDYPPNAIVVLSPLALVPWPWLVPLWTALGLALAPLLGYLVVRAVWRGNPFGAAVPMLLFLCWTSTRTLLQFSALSMTLAFLSLRLVDAHRLASGVALGLALFKPHIAGPIALWMVVTGRARVAIVASVRVVLAGWLAYDTRIGENPLTTLNGYRHVLGTLHAGPDGLLGPTRLRELDRDSCRRQSSRGRQRGGSPYRRCCSPARGGWRDATRGGRSRRAAWPCRASSACGRSSRSTTTRTT